MPSLSGVRVTGIDHVVLNVSDVERSVAWYRDTLGLEPLRLDEWRRREAPFVSLRLGPTTILDLFEATVTGVNVDHVALVVEDVDLQQLSRTGGLPLEGEPAALFGARGLGTGVYLRDPDGHRVELRTYP